MGNYTVNWHCTADISLATTYSVNNNHCMSTNHGGHYIYDRIRDCMRRASCLDLLLVEIEIWADPQLYYNNPAFKLSKIKMIQTIRKKIEVCPDTGAHKIAWISLEGCTSELKYVM